MKRILLLADVNSPHIQKWAIALASEKFEIGIYSIAIGKVQWWKKVENISVLNSGSAFENNFSKNNFFKLKYLSLIPGIKKAIHRFKPEVVHAHYATSYGMLGRWSKFHPLLISAWGSDVLDFPSKSFFHRWLVRKNLFAADKILATSRVLQDELRRKFNRDSTIVPFGVDVNIFKPGKAVNYFEEDVLVIGTIKSLEKIYCIDVLIEAFAKLFQKHPQVNLRLLIVGDGREMSRLKAMADNLGLKDAVKFAGKIPFDQVHEYHNMMDIFANLSEYESFGVSVLEASACAKPVVATDTGGLREVVRNGKTGFLVPVRDVDATAGAMEKLILDRQLREEMGKAGRQYVCENFNFEKCLKKMTDIYETL